MTPTRIARALLPIALLTTLVWGALLWWRLSIGQYCEDYNCDLTLAAYSRHYPLCAVDPTCISPFYRLDNAKSRQDWSGIAAYDLGYGQEPPKSSRVLAVPNYLGFMGVMALVVAAMVWFLRRPHIRMMALLSVACWCFLEISWWFVAAWMQNSVPDWLVPIEAALTVLASMSLLGLFAVQSLRTLKQ